MCGRVVPGKVTGSQDALRPGIRGRPGPCGTVIANESGIGELEMVVVMGDACPLGWEMERE